MKIYFTASVAGSNKYAENYKLINDILVNLGHTVKSDHILGKSLDRIRSENDDERRLFYKKVVSWIKDSSLVVSDVSFPSSINVGHEVTLAMDFEKPVLALYSKGNSPIFLEGRSDSKFILLEYDPEDTVALQRSITKSVKKLMRSTDNRFNFFISPEIVRYLDWVAKYKRIPRSVYLREIIEKDIENDEEYASFTKT